jgi:putative transposase
LILAHKIALDPTAEQASYFARACGTARFAYNWALEEWQRQYRAGGKPSESALRKRLNEIKREEFPWMLEVTKVAPQQAIKNLGAAFRRFFSGQGKYPKLKRKGIQDSFRADNGPLTFEIRDRRIKLPITGWVRMRESLRFPGRPISATVSRVADRWYVSIQIEIEPKVSLPENQGSAVGVDLGVKALATMSDGTVFEGPKALRQHLAKLKRLNRSLSRKVKGSSNRRKAKAKLARLHARIANIRKDALHKVTTEIIRRYQVIGIEDLNVRGMVRNEKMARAISDMGFGEFRRQIKYKAALYGRTVVVIPRFYPSSKTCSGCGHILETLPLSAREWACPSCGTVHDRDLNAATNLKLAASSAVTACGEESSGGGLAPVVKLTSMKRELSRGLPRGQENGDSASTPPSIRVGIQSS